MELTQLNWENVWNKIHLNKDLHKLETPNGIIWKSKLENFAEIRKENWWDNIINPLKDAHIELNWIKIEKKEKLNFWDTISLWEKKENIFAVHKKWANLEEKDLKNHFDKAGYQAMKQEMDMLLERVEKEEKLIKTFFIVLLVITIIFSWAVFYLWNTNSSLVWKINKLIVNQEEIIQIKDVLWETEENWEWEVLTISENIQNLKKENWEYKDELNEIKWDLDSIKTLPKDTKEEIDKLKKEIFEAVESKIGSWKTTLSESQIEEIVKEIKTEMSKEEIQSWEKVDKIMKVLKLLIKKVNKLEPKTEKIEKKIPEKAEIKNPINEENQVICSQEFEPQCWKSTICEWECEEKTYSNKCILDSEKAEFLYEWACKELKKETETGSDLWQNNEEIKTYIAYWCGSCWWEEKPEEKCLFEENWDDLKKIIEDDKKLKNSEVCNTMGCSIWIKYSYCD